MIKQILDKTEKQKIARQILEALPEWFEVEEGREEYIAVLFFCNSFSRNLVLMLNKSIPQKECHINILRNKITYEN